MKRYGDNLPSSNTLEEDSENGCGKSVQVIRGGCSVRYEMLDFIAGAEPSQVRKPSKISTFFKRGLKKVPITEG